MLDIVADLATELEREDVSYCHFKSTEHLDAAVRGETDLDLLVDPGDRSRVDRIIQKLDFRHASPPPGKRFPGVWDLIGFDGPSGSLVHLHMHEHLILGESRVKNHHLAVEDWMLEDTRLLRGVRVPAPERELVLLYVRALLKANVRTMLGALLGRRPSPLSPGIAREADWLAHRVVSADVTSAVESSGLPLEPAEVREFVARIAAGRVSVPYVFKTKRSLQRRLRGYRRFSAPVCLARKVLYRLRFSRPVARLSPPSRKRLVDRGLYVALVGADGSGKTTLSTDLVEWLSWKLDARRVYFGQPKGRGLFRWLRRGANAFRRLDRPGAPAVLRRTVVALAELSEAAGWVYVATRRLLLDRHARRLRTRGVIVVTDRYPLQDLWSSDASPPGPPMDGPRIPLDDGRALRLLGRLERAVYHGIGLPDRVFLLEGSEELLRRRDPELAPTLHRAKVAAIERAASTGVHCVLDVSRDYPEVARAARRRLWRDL